MSLLSIILKSGESFQIYLISTLLCKGKRQYLLTCKVSRYCLLPLHSRTGLVHLVFSTEDTSEVELWQDHDIEKGAHNENLYHIHYEKRTLYYPWWFIRVIYRPTQQNWNTALYHDQSGYMPTCLPCSSNCIIMTNDWAQLIIHSKQYRFFKKKPSVLLPCNPWRTLQGFSRGCMVIVLKGSFLRTYIVYSVYAIYTDLNSQWWITLIYVHQINLTKHHQD